MRFFQSIQSALLCLAPLAQAAKLTVNIPPSSLLPNPATLPASTHATLQGAPGVFYHTRISPSNSLVFSDISEGSYLLNIYTRDYSFPPFRVDVSPEEAGLDESPREKLVEVWQTFRANEWSNKGPKFGEGKKELSVNLQPNARKEFYQERGGFSILSFLKSPMILMALGSVGLIFGMPYLMDNMDPETRAEFEEMQKKSPVTGAEGAAASIQNFDLASFLAGKSSDTSSSSGSGAKARR